MYLACGTDDFLISGNHQLRDLFIENGYDVTYDEIPGGHDWTFWDRQIEKPLNGFHHPFRQVFQAATLAKNSFQPSGKNTQKNS